MFACHSRRFPSPPCTDVNVPHSWTTRPSDAFVDKVAAVPATATNALQVYRFSFVIIFIVRLRFTVWWLLRCRSFRARHRWCWAFAQGTELIRGSGTIPRTSSSCLYPG